MKVGVNSILARYLTFGRVTGQIRPQKSTISLWPIVTPAAIKIPLKLHCIGAKVLLTLSQGNPLPEGIMSKIIETSLLLTEGGVLLFQGESFFIEILQKLKSLLIRKFSSAYRLIREERNEFETATAIYL